MICTTCGAQIDDATKFCPYCGAKVEERPVAAPGTGGGEPAGQPNASAGAQAHAQGNPRPSQRPQPAPHPTHPQPAPQPAAIPSPAPQQPAPQPASQPAYIPQQHAPQPAPQPAPIPQQHAPKRGRAVLIAIFVTAFIAGGVTASTYFLGLWGRAADAASQTAKNAAAAIAAFGQNKAVDVSSMTLVVPKSAKDEPLPHYYVRIREAASADGKAIPVFSYPRLEVKTTKGFKLADFAEDLPAGTYILCTTDDDGSDQVLPPLTLAGPQGSGDAGKDGSGQGDTGNSSGGSGTDAPKLPETLDVVVPGSPDAPKGDGNADDAKPKQGKYGAFLKVIQDLKGKYGEPSTGTDQYGSPISKGVVYAQLRDFGDGVERLVVAHRDEAGVSFNESGNPVTENYIIEVYEYDAKTDSAKQLLSSGSSHGQDLTTWLRYTTGENGSMYLQIAQGGDSESLMYYGIKDDGSFGLAMQADITVDYVGSGAGMTMTSTYAINGKQVDETTFDSENAKYGYNGFIEGAEASEYEDWLFMSGSSDAQDVSKTVATVDALVANLTRATTNDDSVETKVVGDDGVESSTDSNSGNDSKANKDAHAALDKIVQQYQAAVKAAQGGESISGSDPRWPDINTMVFEPGVDPAKLRYAYLDANGDGADELYIAADWTGYDATFAHPVYGVYAFLDGEVKRLFHGVSKDCMLVCKDGYLREVESGGWVSGSYRCYQVPTSGGGLIVREQLQWDGDSGGTSLTITHIMGDGAPDVDVTEPITKKATADGGTTISTPTYDKLKAEMEQKYPERTDIEWKSLV